MSEFETLIGLVSKYSPSGQERDAVEWLVARMKSLGYDNAYIDNAGKAEAAPEVPDAATILISNDSSGDVTGDGKVDIGDALRARSASQWGSFSQLQPILRMQTWHPWSMANLSPTQSSSADG